MASILLYLGAAMFVPRRAFLRLGGERRKFAKGFRVTLLVGILYTLSVIGLAASGAMLPAPVFLPLDPHNYYFYEIFFTLPAIIIAWLIASGSGTLVSLVMGGRGPFKAAAAPWAFAFAAPAFMMWLPHAVFSGFLLLGMSQKEFMSYTAESGPWQTGFWIYQGLAVLLLIVGSVKAAAVGRSLRPVAALLTGLFAAGVCAGIIGLLIR
jgi:hypothetical protein